MVILSPIDILFCCIKIMLLWFGLTIIWVLILILPCMVFNIIRGLVMDMMVLTLVAHPRLCMVLGMKLIELLDSMIPLQYMQMATGDEYMILVHRILILLTIR